MIWAQIFPFVALQLYSEGDGGDLKENLTLFLIGSLVAWILLNLAFLGSIDLKYIHTFFTTSTAPQYTYELYLSSKTDETKFSAIFKKRINYTKSIHSEVREWINNKSSIGRRRASRGS